MTSFKHFCLVALITITIAVANVSAVQNLEQEISTIDKIINQLQAHRQVLIKAVKQASVKHAQQKIDEDHRKEDDKCFDFFTLSLQWPGSVCNYLSPCAVPKTAVNEFTIHGLWPDRNTSNYPQNCESPAGQFNASTIQLLYPQLRQFWTDYKPNSEPSFWAHEWNKHGTCASILPNLSSQLQYFEATIKLVQSLQVTAALAKHKILPHASNKYDIALVKTALKKELGGIPNISCGEKGEIKELRLCVNKELKVFDCLDTRSRNSCQQLLFPPV